MAGNLSRCESVWRACSRTFSVISLPSIHGSRRLVLALTPWGEVRLFHLAGSLSGVVVAAFYVLLPAPLLQCCFSLTSKTPSCARISHSSRCCARRRRGFCLIFALLKNTTESHVRFRRAFLLATWPEARKTWPAWCIPDFRKPCFLLFSAWRFLRFSVCAVFRHLLCLLFGVGVEGGGGLITFCFAGSLMLQL